MDSCFIRLEAPALVKKRLCGCGLLLVAASSEDDCPPGPPVAPPSSVLTVPACLVLSTSSLSVIMFVPVLFCSLLGSVSSGGITTISVSDQFLYSMERLTRTSPNKFSSVISPEGVDLLIKQEVFAGQEQPLVSLFFLYLQVLITLYLYRVSKFLPRSQGWCLLLHPGSLSCQW